jgi:hypothetical protein
MSTIFSDTTCTVKRQRGRAPGVAYEVTSPKYSNRLFVDFARVSEDGMLAILLDRAEKEDAKAETKATSARVTLIKKLKSGNDLRGRGKAKPKGEESTDVKSI